MDGSSDLDFGIVSTISDLLQAIGEGGTEELKCGRVVFLSFLVSIKTFPTLAAEPTCGNHFLN